MHNAFHRGSLFVFVEVKFIFTWTSGSRECCRVDEVSLPLLVSRFRFLNCAGSWAVEGAEASGAVFPGEAAVGEVFVHAPQLLELLCHTG